MQLTEVFKTFYLDMVKSLPMCDSYFTAGLYSSDLLPGDLKEQLKSLPTQADKAVHFLDHVIQPAVMNGDNSGFMNLLELMENSQYIAAKILANQIRPKIQQCSNTTLDQVTCATKTVNNGKYHNLHESIMHVIMNTENG